MSQFYYVYYRVFLIISILLSQEKAMHIFNMCNKLIRNDTLILEQVNESRI